MDRTGPAMLHAGEFVVTKNADNMTVNSGNGEGVSREELAEIKNVLVDIREQNRRYQEDDLALTGEMENSLKQASEASRRIANG